MTSKRTHTQRKMNVIALLRAGHGVRETSRLTGEHLKQVQRWRAKEGVYTRKTFTPHKQRARVDYHQENVHTGGFWTAFDADGRPEAIYERHPVEDIEPREDVPEVAPVFAAALRYLMRQEPRPMAVVAAEIGCTRAAISRTLVLLSDRMGFKALNQKSDQARKHYRKAREAVVKKRPLK